MRERFETDLFHSCTEMTESRTRNRRFGTEFSIHGSIFGVFSCGMRTNLIILD